MNFADEEYVRLYTSDTVTWKCLGWEGQALLALALRKFDKSGVFEFGKHGPEKSLLLSTGLPIEIVKAGLPRILEEEIWLVQEGRIFWPMYIEAQTCRRSDKIRKRISRANRDPAANGTSKVYFLQSENGGPVKIGVAINVKTRVAELQTARPDRLAVLLEVDGDGSLEKELHQLFSSDRISGEWFNPSQRILDWISSRSAHQSVTESGFCHERSHRSHSVTPGEARRGEARQGFGSGSDARDESLDRSADRGQVSKIESLATDGLDSGWIQPTQPPQAQDGSVERPSATQRRDPMRRAMEPKPKLADELFEAYRVESGLLGARCDGSRASLFLRLAHEGVTADEVRLVVRGAKLDDWARDTKKMSANVILSTADQREKYMAIARDPPRPKGARTPPQPDDPENPWEPARVIA